MNIVSADTTPVSPISLPIQFQENKDTAQSKIKDINEEIDKILEEIDKNKKDMTQVSQKIKENRSKLNKLDSTYNKYKKLYNTRIRGIYTSQYGQFGYISVLLNSKNEDEFFSKIVTVYTIINHDNFILSHINDSQRQLKREKAQLLEKQNQLDALKKQNQIVLEKLNSDIKKETSILDMLNEEEAKVDNQNNNGQVDQVQINEYNSKLSLSRGTSISFSKKIEVNATAYCDDGITATGVPTVRNPQGYSTIAVDPRVISLGSRVYIPDYGYAIAVDTGGLIKGNRIDLFMNSKNDAEQWGIKKIIVYILD